MRIRVCGIVYDHQDEGDQVLFVKAAAPQTA